MQCKRGLLGFCYRLVARVHRVWTALSLSMVAVAQLRWTAACRAVSEIGGERRWAAVRVAAADARSGGDGAVLCLWSLSKLWVALISRHSDLHADLPRRKKRSHRR
jgi:hypothetical protein